MLGLKSAPTPGRRFGIDTGLFDGKLEWVREAVHDVDIQSGLAAQAGFQTGGSQGTRLSVVTFWMRPAN